MNVDNLNLWLRSLWDEEFPQCERVLHVKQVGGEQHIGMCCLGVGAFKAGIEGVAVIVNDDNGLVGQLDGFGEGDVIVGYVTASDTSGATTTTDDGRILALDMQPPEFNDWLGVSHGTLTLGVSMKTLDSTQLVPRHIGLHELNDWSLTFPQIADLINNLGIAVEGELQ